MGQMETARTEGIRPPLGQAFPTKSTQSLHTQGLLQKKEAWSEIIAATPSAHTLQDSTEHMERTQKQEPDTFVFTARLHLSWKKSVFPACSMALLKHSPRAAAVQCAIMKPEFRPPSVTKNAGSSLSEGLQSLSILLSLIAASSCTPIAK